MKRNTCFSFNTGVSCYICYRTIILKFCLEHGNDIIVLCAKFQNDFMSKMNIMNECGIVRFEFKVWFGEGYPTWHQSPAESGPRLNIKTVFPMYGIPMLKIRRSRDRLIFNMGNPILVRRHLYIETAAFSRHVEAKWNISFEVKITHSRVWWHSAPTQSYVSPALLN